MSVLRFRSLHDPAVCSGRVLASLRARARSPGSTIPLIPSSRPLAFAGRAKKAALRKCPEPGCNFVTNQGQARLEKHIATHRNEKPHRCPEPGCDKAFKTAELLKQHSRCHTVERNYKCSRPLCASHEAFKSLAELKLHEKRIHTLDRSEHRELKLRARVAKLEQDLNGARADNDMLRKAAEVLQASLREVTTGATSSGKRRRQSKDGVAGGKVGSPGSDAGGGGSPGGDAEGSEDESGGRTSSDARVGSTEDDGCEDNKSNGGGGSISGRKRKRGKGRGKKAAPRKAYTLSAASVLKAAQQAAQAVTKATTNACAPTESRADEERGAANGNPSYCTIAAAKPPAAEMVVGQRAAMGVAPSVPGGAVNGSVVHRVGNGSHNPGSAPIVDNGIAAPLMRVLAIRDRRPTLDSAAAAALAAASHAAAAASAAAKGVVGTREESERIARVE